MWAKKKGNHHLICDNHRIHWVGLFLQGLKCYPKEIYSVICTCNYKQQVGGDVTGLWGAFEDWVEKVVLHNVLVGNSTSFVETQRRAGNDALRVVEAVVAVERMGFGMVVATVAGDSKTVAVVGEVKAAVVVGMGVDGDLESVDVAHLAKSPGVPEVVYVAQVG